MSGEDKETDEPRSSEEDASRNAGEDETGDLRSESSSGEQFSSVEDRDEVKEIQKLSEKDTSKVKVWRLLATFVLLLTAFAVTYLTFRMLKHEEERNFEIAYDQFSRGITDAALAQQKSVREASNTFETFVTSYASNSNKVWPFVQVPDYEPMAANVLKQGSFEMISLQPKVTEENREKYERFVSDPVNLEWVSKGHMYQKGSMERFTGGMDSFYPHLTAFGPNGLENNTLAGPHWPIWQYSPPPASLGNTNADLASVPDYAAVIAAVLKLKNETLITKVRAYKSVPIAMTQEEHDAMHSQHAGSKSDHPHSFVFHPIHKELNNYESEIVAISGAALAWDAALRNLLPEGVDGLHAVVVNHGENCGQAYTYELRGKDALFIGEGDHHEKKYENMRHRVNLAQYTNTEYLTTPGHCQFEINVYPTTQFKERYDENTPEIFAAVVAVTFGLVAIVFYAYDTMVQRRNDNLTYSAAKTNAIVTSMGLPENIRERLMGEKDVTGGKKGNLKKFLHEGKNGSEADNLSSRPLADLFLDTTVMYADINGFSAWSSVREPFQIFTLLEIVYQAFDDIAKKRRIFKVETVGDCYVAVCGLPEPRADHAVAITRYSRDIIQKMNLLAQELEIKLGPDTGDLSLRVGIHSGPCTAGVLRGERARFQLFGDTMNICARLEHSSMRGRIHASKATADLLRAAGKESWLEKREECSADRGNLCFETFWVQAHKEFEYTNSSVVSCSSNGLVGVGVAPKSFKGQLHPSLDERIQRLVKWNAETLLALLRQVIASRKQASSSQPFKLYNNKPKAERTPLEEVQEIIELPEFDGHACRKQQDPDAVFIPDGVKAEIHHLVSAIATKYRDNPFHSFEHASHVVMSVIKLLSRIVAPDIPDIETNNVTAKSKRKSAATLHDHTYGINSDPLTLFACSFAALIHDLDHQGVPNAQLVSEGADVAASYNGRSVAEQNSLDLAWELLMGPEYQQLRAMLFPTDAEMIRFRKLVVNSVMATDIADKELKDLRNGRWDKAFKRGAHADFVDANPRDEINRKATIVIEFLIQASDVSHTMQHWQVYQTWNRKLYEELYVAYMEGRATTDPAEFWYKGEIGFFDFYIIPLTKKLKECGVFGISSDEYLNYAEANRQEWAARGNDIVEELRSHVKRKYGDKNSENELEA